MKRQLLFGILAVLLLASLASAEKHINPDGTADSWGGWDLYSADKTPNYYIVGGLIVAASLAIAHYRPKGKRALPIIAVASLIFLASLSMGYLSVSSSQIWQDDWIDCSGMSQEQMVQAASNRCFYAEITSYSCGSAQTYYQYASTALIVGGNTKCRSDADCANKGDEYFCHTSDDYNIEDPFNKGYIGYCKKYGSSTNQLESVGVKRRLTWTCATSGQTDNACSSDSDCDDDAKALSWTTYFCDSDGDCVGDSPQQTTDNPECAEQPNPAAYCLDIAEDICEPFGVLNYGCLTSRDDECPANAYQTGPGCYYRCSYNYLYCSSDSECSSGKRCYDGVCIDKDLPDPEPISSDSCTITCDAGYTLVKSVCQCVRLDEEDVLGQGDGGSGDSGDSGTSDGSDSDSSSTSESTSDGQSSSSTSSGSSDTSETGESSTGIEQYNWIWLVLALLVGIMILASFGRRGQGPSGYSPATVMGRQAYIKK